MNLLEDTARLVAVPSVSHHEAALADLVESRLREVGNLQVDRVGANVVARTDLGRARRVLLAGHLDTVPSLAGQDNGNEVARLDGDTLWGLGAADMKGGLAVMLALASLGGFASDVTWVFYACEEVARADNGLLEIERERPELLAADAAILGEPTDSLVEAGCQGVLKLEVTVTGRRAHTARPWMGVNALHRLGPILDRVAAFQPREPVVDGCRYKEALQAVAVAGGVAANVVPDSAVLTLNHRFAPDRDAAAATAAIRALLEPLGAECVVVDQSPPAPPALEHPVLSRLLAASGSPPRAKLGWTDAAFFAERGIPAANFGPGDPELAHAADERVTGAALQRSFEVLAAVLDG